MITENNPMKKIAIPSLLAFAFLAVLAAQTTTPTPPTSPDPSLMVQHRVDFLTQKLGLSTTQQQQATTIFTNVMTSQKSLHDQMHTAHQTLQTAISNNDAASIDQAANSIGNLTGQSVSLHAKAQAAFLQILNPQQQSTYNQMMQQHEGLGFGRHGGPHPF
jgi:Spy/CpxP family protein refolding chaperone